MRTFRMHNYTCCRCMNVRYKVHIKKRLSWGLKCTELVSLMKIQISWHKSLPWCTTVVMTALIYWVIAWLGTYLTGSKHLCGWKDASISWKFCGQVFSSLCQRPCELLPLLNNFSKLFSSETTWPIRPKLGMNVP